ncbi:MAG: sorbitol dehydrogenase [Pelagibacterium sp. SCN 63-23]|nr:MAG: sorbitol dehydrogenase [Pelagibacterium sp. SCN 63-23]
MKVVRIAAEGQSEFADVERTAPGAGDVVLAVKHVGLCGSDLNTFKGLNPLVQLPRIPGHEIGGEVIAVGDGVDAGLVGQRAIVVPYTNCGTCSSCRKGRLNACRYNKTLGVQQDGGLAEFLVLPADKIILNASLAPAHLALVEPLSVGFHAVARGSVGANDTVVVLGCGMIGMGAIIGAAARGARVIAVDVNAQKAEFARQFGASEIIVAGSEDVAARVEALTNGDGADVVIEAVGLPLTFTQAVDFAGFAGRVVYVGYSKAPVSYETRFFNLKELDILGSRNATRADFEAVIAYLETLGSKADGLISKRFAFADADKALPFWAENPDALKVVIEVAA